MSVGTSTLERMFEKMFHPWRQLRGLEDVTITWESREGRLGETNGTTHINLHPNQSQVQRRCTLTHELAHIHLGHVHGSNEYLEAQADTLAAQWLIPLPHLINAMRWSDYLEEIAEELWVDLPTLKARFQYLTDPEIAAIRRALEEP